MGFKGAVKHFVLGVGVFGVAFFCGRTNASATGGVAVSKDVNENSIVVTNGDPVLIEPIENSDKYKIWIDTDEDGKHSDDDAGYFKDGENDEFGLPLYGYYKSASPTKSINISFVGGIQFNYPVFGAYNTDLPKDVDININLIDCKFGFAPFYGAYCDYGDYGTYNIKGSVNINIGKFSYPQPLYATNGVKNVGNINVVSEENSDASILKVIGYDNIFSSNPGTVGTVNIKLDSVSITGGDEYYPSYAVKNATVTDSVDVNFSDVDVAYFYGADNVTCGGNLDFYFKKTTDSTSKVKGTITASKNSSFDVKSSIMFDGLAGIEGSEESAGSALIGASDSSFMGGADFTAKGCTSFDGITGFKDTTFGLNATDMRIEVANNNCPSGAIKLFDNGSSTDVSIAGLTVVQLDNTAKSFVGTDSRVTASGDVGIESAGNTFSDSTKYAFSFVKSDTDINFESLGDKFGGYEGVTIDQFNGGFLQEIVKGEYSNAEELTFINIKRTTSDQDSLSAYVSMNGGSFNAPIISNKVSDKTGKINVSAYLYNNSETSETHDVIPNNADGIAKTTINDNGALYIMGDKTLDASLFKDIQKFNKIVLKGVQMNIGKDQLPANVTYAGFEAYDSVFTLLEDAKIETTGQMALNKTTIYAYGDIKAGSLSPDSTKKDSAVFIYMIGNSVLESESIDSFKGVVKSALTCEYDDTKGTVERQTRSTGSIIKDDVEYEFFDSGDSSNQVTFKATPKNASDNVICTVTCGESSQVIAGTGNLKDHYEFTMPYGATKVTFEFAPIDPITVNPTTIDLTDETLTVGVANESLCDLSQLITISNDVENGTVKYTAAEGALPAGLTLSTAGVISGTPTKASAAKDIEITVTGKNTTTATVTLKLPAVAKGTPTYAVPTALTKLSAKIGTKTSEIKLPKGYAFAEDELIDTKASADEDFAIYYTPSNKDDYDYSKAQLPEGVIWNDNEGRIELAVKIKIQKEVPQASDYALTDEQKKLTFPYGAKYGDIKVAVSALSDANEIGVYSFELPDGKTFNDIIGNVGSYVFELKFTASDATKYDTEPIDAGSLTVTVTKKTMVLEDVFEDLNLPTTASANAGDTVGTLTEEIIDKLPKSTYGKFDWVTYELTRLEDGGKIQAAFYPNDTRNYNWISNTPGVYYDAVNDGLVFEMTVVLGQSECNVDSYPGTVTVEVGERIADAALAYVKNGIWCGTVSSENDGAIKADGVPDGKFVWVSTDPTKAIESAAVEASGKAKFVPDSMYFKESEILDVTVIVKHTKHVWKTSYDYDSTSHWHECSILGCGEESTDKADHDFDDLVTEYETYKKCKVCGFETGFKLKPDHPVDPDDPDPECSHVFANRIKKDLSGHERYCIECGKVISEAEHIYETDYYKQADPTKGHMRKCSVCGYELNEAHELENKFDNIGHYSVCKDCGYETDVVKHTLSDTASKDKDGHWFKCTGCEYETEKTPHTSNKACVCNADKASGHHKVCDVCGAVFANVDHEFGEWITVKEATTTEEGSKKRVCIDCGYEETETIGKQAEEHEHAQAAGGYQSNVNSHWKVCDEDGEVFGMASHEFGEWTTIEASTTTKQGTEERVCETCGYSDTRKLDLVPAGEDPVEPVHIHKAAEGAMFTYNENVHWKKCADDDAKVEMAAHDFIIMTDGTDGKGGKYHWQKCKVCGYETAKIAHTYGGWTVDSQPSEIAPGKQHRECSICGNIEEEEISPLGHTHNWDMTKYKYDDENHWHVCTGNAAHKKDVEAHKFGEWTTIVASTTEIPGTEKRVCETCGYSETRDLDLIPEGEPEEPVHIHEAAEGAAFEYNENVHWQKCAADDTKVNMAAHDFEIVTDKKDGKYHWQKCKVCGYEIKTAHTYGGWIVDSQPTATEPGEQHRVCSICNYEEKEEISPLGHTHTWNMEEYKYDDENHWHECTGNKAHTKDVEAHDFGDGWTTTTPASEYDKGKEERTCSVCGYHEERDIPKLPHATHVFEGEDYLSDADGHWQKCKLCDKTNDVVSHTFDKWVTTKEATETEAGEEKHTCTVCGYEETRPTEKLNHQHVFGDYQKDANGHWRACANCDFSETVAAHTFGDWKEVTAATTTAKGVQKRVCSVCGYEEVADIAMLTPSNPGGQTPDPTNPGGQDPSTPGSTDPTTQPGSDDPTVPATDTPAPVAAGKSVTDTKNKVTYKVLDSAKLTKEQKKLYGDKPVVEYTQLDNKNKTTITVPKTVTIDDVTYTVIKIADQAFKGNKKLKKITIKDNVTEIGKSAFEGCVKLETVVIGKNLTKIGAKAFFNCKALKNMTIGSAGIKTVGKQAFKNAGKKSYKNLKIKTVNKCVKTYTSKFRTAGLNKKCTVKKK